MLSQMYTDAPSALSRNPGGIAPLPLSVSPSRNLRSQHGSSPQPGGLWVKSLIRNAAATCREAEVSPGLFFHPLTNEITHSHWTQYSAPLRDITLPHHHYISRSPMYFQ